jgi:hypothetical protein
MNVWSKFHQPQFIFSWKKNSFGGFHGFESSAFQSFVQWWYITAIIYFVSINWREFLYNGKFPLVTTNVVEISPSWEAARCAVSKELPNILWNPNVHYRSSRKPSTGPYHKPDQSSPYQSILSLRSILIFSTHLLLGLPSGLFPSESPPMPYMHSCSPPFVLHALPVSSSLTWSF